MYAANCPQPSGCRLQGLGGSGCNRLPEGFRPGRSAGPPAPEWRQDCYHRDGSVRVDGRLPPSQVPGRSGTDQIALMLPGRHLDAQPTPEPASPVRRPGNRYLGEGWQVLLKAAMTANAGESSSGNPDGNGYPEY